MVQDFSHQQYVIEKTRPTRNSQHVALEDLMPTIARLKGSLVETTNGSKGNVSKFRCPGGGLAFFFGLVVMKSKGIFLTKTNKGVFWVYFGRFFFGMYFGCIFFWMYFGCIFFGDVFFSSKLGPWETHCLLQNVREHQFYPPCH